MNGWRKSPVLVVVLVLLFSAVTLSVPIIWSISETQRIVKGARDTSAKIAPGDLAHEKNREEFIGKRFENDARGIVANFIIANFASILTILSALGGGMFALYGYIDARRKEALDRAASDLKDTLSHLAGKEPQQRVVGIVGLQHFLVADRKEFHRAAVTALVAAARTEQDSEVLHSIRIAIEQAMRVVGKDVLTQVSWQSVRANAVDLNNLDLQHLDFRDARLENAQFSNARLDGAKLVNAKLQGATFQGAHLKGADLTYADLAGASLASADLTGARFSHARVLNLDLDKAVLSGLEVDWESIPWEKTQNWRSARFDPALLSKLKERYGPPPSGPRVLMLMWEIPPFVAGGTWTACYHFVRNLLRQGADLTIVVPWKQEAILAAPFGSEVTIVPLGIELPRDSWTTDAHGGSSVYGGVRRDEVRSPYGPPMWSAYFEPAWSAYGSIGPSFTGPPPDQAWNPYGWMTPGETHGYRGLHSPYGPYAHFGRPDGTRPTAPSSMRGSVLLRLIDEFRDRLVRYIADESPDIIHAHDWVTFTAAREGARLRRIPWIAHVHSIESERRPEAPDSLIERIEERALLAADWVVTPSRITRDRIVTKYGADGDRIDIVPNVLSVERVDALTTGRYETGRVRFLGRLSPQKGVDIFLKAAAELRSRLHEVEFDIFGSGYYPIPSRSDFIHFHGPLAWERRNDAFRDASVIVVPSRAEPFGMVILEAMLHRVPVIYPVESGAAEVLASGIKVNATDSEEIVRASAHLLTNLGSWEDVVEGQIDEITRYPARGFEKKLIERWASLAGQSSLAGAGALQERTAPSGDLDH
jgi:glycosyltransferase involved in cell wall biosynthesis/uncharacterized protein YjbI with pentapeptide repeats